MSIKARRSGSHVIAAATKASQLQRIDIVPLDHFAYAPGLTLNVAKR